MTDRDRAVARPLEETPEAAAAVDDESTVPQLQTGGQPDRDTPTLMSPQDTRGPIDNLRDVRTGADQSWDPEDLAVADGHDPTPRNVERARRELDRNGPAAIEKTVP
ncbi:hypothetical protein SAMN05444365_10184 [Micromonospora pattaloongensis]|uniref:Uncharacterized protein n=1 Tax=Micromonospora pattaloongensis TaxID=405436 RepID=A0A1H3FN50_9ACTN|nr:hypothetical protein [Micromonospora pattaloongensis]SDX92227.1 hypothetical protein SAMN05444365_10184 [Micromonospora pattaloongensis]